jgi:FkbM family methyltransferase
LKTLVKNCLNSVRKVPAIFYGIRFLRPGPDVWRHLYFTGNIDVKVSENASFRIHHFGAHVENSLFWAGYGHGWEGFSLRIWRELCERAHFIADVGANTGVYALAAGAINTSARIVALEPVPAVYGKLALNISLNDFKIEPFKLAASDRDGNAVMFGTSGEFSYSSSLEARHAISQIMVPTVRLDSFFDQIKFDRIDLVKIDVETHEPHVLTGMKGRLQRDRPTLLIEILDASVGAAVEKQLVGLDYNFFAIDELKGLMATTRLTGQGGGRNYLVCQKNVAETVAPGCRDTNT